ADPDSTAVAAELADCTITFQMRTFPAAWWVTQFCHFVKSKLFELAFADAAAGISGYLEQIEPDWTASTAPAAKAKAAPKPKAAAVLKPKLKATLRDDFELVFCGSVGLTKSTSCRSYPVCALKVCAPDTRDDTVLGVYVSEESVNSISDECPCPAWLVNTNTHTADGIEIVPNLKMIETTVRVTLPSHLHLPTVSDVGLKVASDLPPKKRPTKQQHTNAPPADATSLFGPTAAALFISEHPPAGL
ncbi:unnamed protein product, partial [Prorocentrum cordatum]